MASTKNLLEFKKLLLSLKENYPSKEYYRLVVDGKLHKKESGWVGYEKREPGCLKALFKGLGLAITNLEDTTLTTSLIEQLHIACAGNVATQTKTEPGKIREHMTGWLVDPETTTREGVVEWLYELDTQNDFAPFRGGVLGIAATPTAGKFPNSIVPGSEICNATLPIMRNQSKKNNEQIAEAVLRNIREKKASYVPPSPEEVKRKFPILVNNYNQLIVNAKDKDSKLVIIIDLVRALERLHPFSDVNGRVLEICLLTRILIQNGFLPGTFFNPNVFDGHSKSQLRIEVKNAIKNTEDVIDGKKVIFDFDTDTIPPAYQQKYSNFVSEFVTKIDQEINALDQKIEDTHSFKVRHWK